MSPDSMKAVRIGRFGGPEVLEVTRVPRPRPAADQVLVRVGTSGVNRADLIQRTGRYPAPAGAPEDIPGLEYAGWVSEVGEAVTRWREGDRVMGLVAGGGYAEYVTAHERTVVRVPDNVSLEDAGGIPEVFMTAFDAVFVQMGLHAGERLLIHAVGSGVGTAAVQLAAAAGATTVGTSRTPEKVERARGLGLDLGVVADGDWAAAVLDATNGAGVDVVLDLVGGPYLAGNLEVLATGGRIIVVGVPGGSGATIELRRLMLKRASITGTVLRARPLEEKIALAREFERRVVPLFESGRLAPVVDRRYQPEEASSAHQWMQENRTFGKVLITWE